MGNATRITIDPGLSGTGYALWDDGWKLIESGVRNAPKDYDWESKGFSIISDLEDIVEFNSEVRAGYIEFPAFFGSAGGATVASSGALVKLAWFVGVVCARLKFTVELVEVRDWKGQLPKEVVIKRIKRILPRVKAISHAWDAIGIGLYKRGDFD